MIREEYYELTPEMEKEYKLDQIELPENLFDTYDLDFTTSPTYIDEFEIYTEVFELTEEEIHQNFKCRYESFAKYLTPDEDVIEVNNGLIAVRCKWCKEYFLPTYTQMWNRVQALLGQSGFAENSFYCSDTCKKSCPIFRRRVSNSNENQSKDFKFLAEARVVVFDRAGHECEICGSKDNLEMHHIKPMKTDPLESYDLDNLICCCHKCHKEKGHSDRECTTGYLANCEFKE